MLWGRESKLGFRPYPYDGYRTSDQYSGCTREAGITPCPLKPVEGYAGGKGTVLPHPYDTMVIDPPLTTPRKVKSIHGDTVPYPVIEAKHAPHFLLTPSRDNT